MATLNFNTGKNYIVPSENDTTYRGLAGDDVYIISQATEDNAVIKIIETEGSNVIQLVDGITISTSLFTKNAARLTLSNGAEITINGADKFTFETSGNAFTFDLDPCFENSVADATALPAMGGVYRYWDKAEIVYIGRGKNINSRSKDNQRNSWVYDKIEYSLINDEHDQSFWESKFINAFKTEFGRLPRYNEVAGASIIKLENGRTNESII